MAGTIRATSSPSKPKDKFPMTILLNHEFKLGAQKAPVFARYDAEGNEIESFVYRLELSTFDGRLFTHPKFGGQDLG